MRTSIIVLLVSATIFTSTAASADDNAPNALPTPTASRSPPSIEESGHVIVDRFISYGLVPGTGVNFGGIISYSSGSTDGTSTSPTTGTPMPASSRWTLTSFSPSLDYVFARRFTIGATVLVGNVHMRSTDALGNREDDTFTFSVVPRIGYVRALTDDLAIWTRVGFGGSESLTGSVESASGWEFDADSLLVLRAGRYLMANIGPAVRYSQLRVRQAGPYSNGTDGKTTGFGLGARIAVGLVF